MAYTNTNWKKANTGVIISNKENFKIKKFSFIKDEKWHFIMIKVSVSQEDMDTPSNIYSKYINQN